MGRPKVNPDEKITKAIPVKFSNIDRMRVKERAQKDRIPVSMWIRNAVLEKLNGGTDVSK